MRRAERTIRIYVICDYLGHIRYVGQCYDLGSRMRNHLWSDKPVSKWLREEVRQGRIPKAFVMADFVPMPGICSGLARWSANALENHMIRHYHEKQPGELLNRAGKPKTPKPRSAYRWPKLNVPKCKETKVRYKSIVANYDLQPKRQLQET